MHLETQAKRTLVTSSSTSCTSKRKPNAPLTAEGGDTSKPNYAAQKPSERANNETSADFVLKAHMANPKRKPSRVCRDRRMDWTGRTDGMDWVAPPANKYNCHYYHH